jgi:hypothetical protein
MEVSTLKKISMLLGFAFVLVILFSSCSTFLDSALDTAAGIVGKKVGDTVGTAAASAVFATAFYHGGYAFEVKEYRPGEWTRWQTTGMEEGEEFEKAFLKKLDDGKEWWQVIVRSVREGEKEEVILEALFSPVEDEHRELLRMRALFPGDEEPSEIPVEKDSGWYGEPTELTDESLAAAKKGNKKVTVPAGTFTAEHIVFKDVRGVGEWWLVSQVPGSIVKYVIKESAGEGEQDTYTAELADYGKKAATRLQSY